MSARSKHRRFKLPCILDTSTLDSTCWGDHSQTLVSSLLGCANITPPRHQLCISRTQALKDDNTQSEYPAPPYTYAHAQTSIRRDGGSAHRQIAATRSPKAAGRSILAIPDKNLRHISRVLVCISLNHMSSIGKIRTITQTQLRACNNTIKLSRETDTKIEIEKKLDARIDSPL